jgi:hypothetical protein
LNDTESEWLNKIVDGIEKSTTWKNMNTFYSGFQTYYTDTLISSMKEFNFELIVYDESEYFRQHDDP